ncbi:hypothetical protein HED22_16525 [Thalassospira sp. HF15]|uniref:hypothetical protein n=1 Tax=Thalassospira sp. HF15 TaxID=2722755 RepID=UPI0014322034|nr:hypothetical protein [Thalassospira sp. HF15]NIY77261.1 hypothetical protein [Thalassospira sp. HF15]
MTKYYSYLHGAKDDHTFYLVANGKLETYDKPVFMFWKKASLVHTLPVDRSSEILEERVETNGNGTIRLRSGKEDRQYWVFGNANAFINAVKSQL